MDTVPGFIILLIAGLATSNPISDETLTVTSEFFPDSLSVYTSNYDIVNLFCPLNGLNFPEDSDAQEVDSDGVYIFFVEADILDGAYDYKGLYILQDKKATKILDNGRDFAASTDDNKKVYLAATDGLYVYDGETRKTEKYGTLTDSFIAIALVEEADFIYGLTEDHVLYKITNEGTEKEVVTDVKNAVQIVVDFAQNLFFINNKKDVFVKRVDGTIKKIKGLPNKPSYGKLLRPAFALEEGTVYVGGKKVYELSANGTSEFQNLFLKERPSAYSLEATLIQYYAYKKKIYEYNILAIILGQIEFDLEDVKAKLEQKSDTIKSMGSKPKKALRAR